MLKIKKIVLSIICVVFLVGGICGVNYLISLQKYKQEISQLKIGSVDLSKVVDGKYIGSCDAEFIASKVEVTVKNKKITNIVLINHKNERGKPAEAITQMVVKNQTLSVDTVSGATNSSKVILKAIENALK